MTMQQNKQIKQTLISKWSIYDRSGVRSPEKDCFAHREHHPLLIKCLLGSNLLQ